MNTYYVSLYGGVTQTMEEKLRLAPGEVKAWEELWYPLAGTGGLTTATREVALSLHTDDGNLLLAVLPTREYTAARLRVTRGGAVLLDRKADLTPKGALVETLKPAGKAEAVNVRITDADGRVLLDETLRAADVRPVFKRSQNR